MSSSQRPRYVNLHAPEGVGSASVQPLGEMRRRITVFALLIGLGYLLNFLQWQVLPCLFGAQSLDEMALREILMMLAALLLRAAARRPEIRPAALIRLAVAVQLTAVFDVSAFSQPIIRRMTEVDGAIGLTWACIMIVIFPWMVPAPLRTHIWVTLVGALILPLYHAALSVIGAVALPVSIISVFTSGQLICAALAITSARIIDRMGREVARVQRELTRLGSYQLVERIGKGGMGEVWLASHSLLVRPAAIKVIKAERLGGDGATAERVLARFEREAQAMAGLRSMHTVELYDYGRSEAGAFYFVMELLDGIDLEVCVERFGPQEPARVLAILRQVALSLAEAHDAGLVHRDIKPANIFICRQGGELDHAKVLDFGLVLRQRIEEYTPDNPRLTEAQQIYGTPAYMAPEQAMGEAVDGRSDLYALGCVAFFLLTGRTVFAEASNMRTMIAQVRKEPPRPSTLRAEIPAVCDELVLWCLAKPREERPQTAWELIDRIDALPVRVGLPREERERWWTALGETRFTSALAGESAVHG